MQSNIKKLRKRQGLTQRELGEKIGVSQQVISRMEREREVIPVDVLINLAAYFKVSTDNVLGYQEPEEKIADWIHGMAAGNISKEDVLTLIEQTDNIRMREWMYIWYLVNVMRERR